MARREKALVERNENGEVVRTVVDGKVTDYSIPQIDAETGIVPEFVNVSNRLQIITVPYSPGHAIRVPPMGILRGAQWRDPYTKPNPAWGKSIPFVERVVEGGKHDPKYVLSVEQAQAMIKALNNPKRIRSLVNNMVIDSSDESRRLRDDRTEVVTAEANRMNEIALRAEARAAG